MQFIETLYAYPLLKFLADPTLKSFVIFAISVLSGTSLSVATTSVVPLNRSDLMELPSQCPA